MVIECYLPNATNYSYNGHRLLCRFVSAVRAHVYLQQPTTHNNKKKTTRPASENVRAQTQAGEQGAHVRQHIIRAHTCEDDRMEDRYIVHLRVQSPKWHIVRLIYFYSDLNANKEFNLFAETIMRKTVRRGARAHSPRCGPYIFRLSFLPRWPWNASSPSRTRRRVFRQQQQQKTAHKVPRGE